jgi:hypothetical protein
MTTVTTIRPLCDGPIDLGSIRNARIEKVTAGAHAVLANRSYANIADAIRTLRQTLGWSTYEAMILVDDICQVAVQHAVAMEISES